MIAFLAEEGSNSKAVKDPHLLLLLSVHEQSSELNGTITGATDRFEIAIAGDSEETQQS